MPLTKRGGTGTARQFQVGRRSPWIRYLHWILDALKSRDPVKYADLNYPAMVAMMGDRDLRANLEATIDAMGLDFPGTYDSSLNYPDYSLSAKSKKRYPRPQGFDRPYKRAPRAYDFKPHDEAIHFAKGPITDPFPNTRKRKRTMKFYQVYDDAYPYGVSPDDWQDMNPDQRELVQKIMVTSRVYVPMRGKVKNKKRKIEVAEQGITHKDVTEDNFISSSVEHTIKPKTLKDFELKYVEDDDGNWAVTFLKARKKKKPKKKSEKKKPKSSLKKPGKKKRKEKKHVSFEDDMEDMEDGDETETDDEAQDRREEEEAKEEKRQEKPKPQSKAEQEFRQFEGWVLSQHYPNIQAYPLDVLGKYLKYMTDHPEFFDPEKLAFYRPYFQGDLRRRMDDIRDELKGKSLEEAQQIWEQVRRSPYFDDMSVDDFISEFAPDLWADVEGKADEPVHSVDEEPLVEADEVEGEPKKKDEEDEKILALDDDELEDLIREYSYNVAQYRKRKDFSDYAVQQMEYLDKLLHEYNVRQKHNLLEGVKRFAAHVEREGRESDRYADITQNKGWSSTQDDVRFVIQFAKKYMQELSISPDLIARWMHGNYNTIFQQANARFEASALTADEMKGMYEDYRKQGYHGRFDQFLSEMGRDDLAAGFAPQVSPEQRLKAQARKDIKKFKANPTSSAKRKLLLKYHPDKHTGEEQLYTEITQFILNEIENVALI